MGIKKARNKEELTEELMRTGLTMERINEMSADMAKEEVMRNVFVNTPMWFDMETENDDENYREPLERTKNLKYILFDTFKETNRVTGTFKFDIKRFVVLSCISAGGDFDKSFKKLYNIIKELKVPKDFSPLSLLTMLIEYCIND